MTRIEKKYIYIPKDERQTQEVSLLSQFFRYIPRSRQSEGQPFFIEDWKVQPRILENKNLQVLKEETIISYPNLQLISRDETQKSIKPSGNETEQEFFLDKRTNEGFNLKA